MSTDTAATPVAAAPTAAVPARTGPRFDQRYLAPLFISCVLLAAHFSARILVDPLKTATAIGVAILCEVVVGRLAFGKWPHLASAYVTGISVGILLRSEAAYWPYAFCSAISILSKYVIRVKGRHIWNPSNFGIAMSLIVAPGAVHTLSNEFGNSIWPMVVIWLLGSFIISRIKRFHICLTYVLSFLAFGWVRHLVTGDPYASEVAPITGPMYQLFTFFMITDPRTTVSGRRAQMGVAFLVAAVEAGLRLAHNIHAPFYALFVVGPAAILAEIWWDGRRRRSPEPALGSAGCSGPR